MKGKKTKTNNRYNAIVRMRSLRHIAWTLAASKNKNMVMKLFNRVGDVYFIKSKLTKKGNEAYYLTKKEDETCLAKIPKGYEVFEKFDSGVLFIRKIRESKFDRTELKLLNEELEKNESLFDFRVDVNGGEIKIYVVGKEYNEGIFELWDVPVYSKEKINKLQERFKRFDEKMRIIVKEKKGIRIFELKRYCYRGSIDSWIRIGKGENFEQLIRANVFHIGKESYYDLM